MPTEQAGNVLTQLPIIPYLLIIAVFYFLVFKPQKDKQKDKEKMVDSLQKNDKVVTAGGMHGTVVLVKDKTVVLRVDEKARIEFDKEAISYKEKTQIKS